MNIYLKFTIIFFILTIIFLFINNKNEYFSSRINIGFIIPTTSNKRNYKTVLDIDFFKIFLNSIKKTKLDKKYNYYFYLGYDHDDIFFNVNDINLKKQFNKYNIPNSKLQTIKIFNKKNLLGQIWSELADEAVKKCDYLYQIGDDIEILTPRWEDKFINTLKKNNNIGVVGPVDIGNPKILTQSFVHKTHLKIFKQYYPNEIQNWYIDDWITNVYKNYTSIIPDVYIKNSGGDSRYNQIKSKKKYKLSLKRDKKILEKYIYNN